MEAKMTNLDDKTVSIQLKINIFEKKRYGNLWTNFASSD